MKRNNEILFKRLNLLIDEFCDDNDLNMALSNDLMDLDFEADICDVHLAKLIKSSPTFYREIIKFENKKLLCKIELSISNNLSKDKSHELINEVSNLYFLACDSNKRLLDLIKQNINLHIKLNNLQKGRFKDEK
jgi:hypothetical protein